MFLWLLQSFAAIVRNVHLRALHTIKPIQRIPGGMVVVLNGFPGTGEHTILKRVLELLPADKTHLIDNHLLIDPVQGLYPNRTAAHHELRRQVRKVYFPWVSRLAQEGHVILMTACLANNARGADFFREHLDPARGKGVPLYFINALCYPEVLVERAQSTERIDSAKTKLTDENVLRELVEAHRLIQPEELNDGWTKLVVDSLDVNGEVDESVRLLMEMVGLG